MLVQSHDYFQVNSSRLHDISSNSNGCLDKSDSHKNTTAEKRPNKKRKKVTFKKDSELVSIRIIPPRPNRSDSSDNGLSSDSSDEDSDSSEDDSSDDEESCHNIMDNISKLVLRHTTVRVKPKRLPHNGDSTTCKPTLPPQPPRLRRPRPTPPSQRKTTTIGKPNKSPTNTNAASSESSKLKSALQTINNRGLARLTPIRRAQSCSVDHRDRQKEQSGGSFVSRVSSAAASLSLSNRQVGTASISSMYSLPPQNERYNQLDRVNSNSGQERTKFYAWQVANGAPLVTTPGISPLCAEQITLTKL